MRTTVIPAPVRNVVAAVVANRPVITVVIWPVAVVVRPVTVIPVVMVVVMTVVPVVVPVSMRPGVSLLDWQRKRSHRDQRKKEFRHDR